VVNIYTRAYSVEILNSNYKIKNGLGKQKLVSGMIIAGRSECRYKMPVRGYLEAI